MNKDRKNELDEFADDIVEMAGEYAHADLAEAIGELFAIIAREEALTKSEEMYTIDRVWGAVS